MNTVYVPKYERKKMALSRFNSAYEIAGKEWRRLVRKADPSLDTGDWERRMNALIGDRKKGERLDVEYIEVLTDALEKAVGIAPSV